MRDLRGGVLVIDKTEGLTSHDIVHVVRRALGRPKTGHTGTLDPFATGVLPLVVGKATRLAQFFDRAEKVYEARFRLGFATDTYDRTGTAVEASVGAANLPNRADVDAALRLFVGTYDQVPPAFSAKKSGGTPAYELARQGKAVEVPAARVTAHAIDILAFDGEYLDVHIHCSSGYYVRSLAHDLGRRLGTGAHVATLRRTRSGPFDLSQAVSLETALTHPEEALGRLVPLEGLLLDLPPVAVTPEGADWIRNGRPLGPAQLATPVSPAPDAARMRLMSPDGLLLAVATSLPDGTLHPALVLG